MPCACTKLTSRVRFNTGRGIGWTESLESVLRPELDNTTIIQGMVPKMAGLECRYLRPVTDASGSHVLMPLCGIGQCAKVDACRRSWNTPAKEHVAVKTMACPCAAETLLWLAFTHTTDPFKAGQPRSGIWRSAAKFPHALQGEDDECSIWRRCTRHHAVFLLGGWRSLRATMQTYDHNLSIDRRKSPIRELSPVRFQTRSLDQHQKQTSLVLHAPRDRWDVCRFNILCTCHHALTIHLCPPAGCTWLRSVGRPGTEPQTIIMSMSGW
nr:hypothetical protein CFP56_04013 [Quercus suber]